MRTDDPSLQEIYDKVVDHLFKQNKQSVLNGKSSLRGAGHAKNVIGLFVDDEDYTPDMDGKTVTDLVWFHQEVVPPWLLDNLLMRSLLSELQETHDDTFNWIGGTREHLRTDLHTIADQFDLSTEHLYRCIPGKGYISEDQIENQIEETFGLTEESILSQEEEQSIVVQEIFVKEGGYDHLVR